MNTKAYTITSALPYANGPLHIGHLAGAYLPADIFVRYLRMRGRDVLWVCGSDEHGAAVTLRAKKEGTTPKAIVDQYHKQIKETFEKFGIAFDIYHRTTEPIHHKTSQDFFTTLYEKDAFVKKTSAQYYDEEFNQFLADRYIKGTCPNCSYDSAYGDQCENCGNTLSPTELINPLSTLSEKTPILKETTHWYLRLDKYQPWLEEWLLEGKKGIWKNNVYGQCSSWLKEGLQPRSMTRDLDWGVDVPLEEAVGKKLYVWLDAPIGYISATKQWAIDNGKDWEPYWKTQENPEDDRTLIHFIGKDNIVFHCIIFPAILHGHEGYLVPENVPANEFLNLEGEKMSTSRNHAVWVHEFVEEFPGKNDVLRYALCSILPENKDSDFTWKDFQARNNNELAAILGNFVNRVIVLTNKYYDATLPVGIDLNTNPAIDDAFAQIDGHIAKVEQSIENYRFREALGEFMNVARVGNKFLTDQEPWKKWKATPELVAPILYASLQIIAKLGILSKVFLPETAEKIFALLKTEDLGWDQLSSNKLVPSGHEIFRGKAEILFAQIEDEVVEAQLKKLDDAKNVSTSNFTPIKEEISFDDFQKMDIRIGTILEATKVPKADKLLQFKVDTGIDVRTIVSGVAKFFQPEDLLGKQVPVLMNLAPRKIRGVVSQGMILFAEDSEENLHLVSPVKEVEAGSGVK